jgi:dTDP-4-dehydrorhamnose 3,5-epimerase
MSADSWSVTGPKDPQLVRSDWTSPSEINIDGVVARPISNVLTDTGYLTEIWRADWVLDDGPVGQVFQRVLNLGYESGWHAHGGATDRLFCAVGTIKVALYDGRRDARTHGNSLVLRIGETRPAMVVVPAGVWHAVRNVGTDRAVFINVVDVAYDYEDPDHYRLPYGTDQIPVEF